MYILIALFTLMVSFKLTNVQYENRTSSNSEISNSSGTRGKKGSNGDQRQLKYDPDDKTPFRCVGKVPDYSIFTQETSGISKELPDQLYSLKEGGRVCNDKDSKPVLQEYKEVRKKHCPCKLCEAVRKVKAVEIKKNDNSIFICNKDVIFDFQNESKAYHVQFEIDGLNSNQRVAYGLAEYTGDLKTHLKTGSGDYADNTEDKTKKLFVGPIIVKSVDDWNCDVSGVSSRHVVTISDNWCADSKYIIGGNNPSGWLNISIDNDGSVTVPMKCQGSEKCKNCRSIVKRTVINEEGWCCDYPGCEEKIEKGGIVYECASNDEICDAVFHAKHLNNQKIIKENEFLKPYRSINGKTAIVSMGYDGYSFYTSSRGNGRRYGLHCFNNGPSCFREYAWGTKYIPVVIVYSGGGNDETNNLHAADLYKATEQEEMLRIVSRSNIVGRYKIEGNVPQHNETFENAQKVNTNSYL
jgi:hypothetical protein